MSRFEEDKKAVDTHHGKFMLQFFPIGRGWRTTCQRIGEEWIKTLGRTHKEEIGDKKLLLVRVSSHGFLYFVSLATCYC